MRLLWVIFLFLPSIWTSFCGRHGVPFSLEILSNGLPVLGCAQPSCIAAPENEFEDDSMFETDDNGQVDGFFREGDRDAQGRINANKYAANCSNSFNSISCTGKNQWVGGIHYASHLKQPLILQCCSFEGLRFSQNVGVTTITAGEAVTGGEVIRDGRQISFDVISNIRRMVDFRDHSIVYQVSVRRFACIPDPAEMEIPFDKTIAEEIIMAIDDNSILGANLAATVSPPPVLTRQNTPEPYISSHHSKRKRPAFGATNYLPTKDEPEEQKSYQQDLMKSLSKAKIEKRKRKQTETVRIVRPRLISKRPKQIFSTTQPPTTTPYVPQVTNQRTQILPSTTAFPFMEQFNQYQMATNTAPPTVRPPAMPFTFQLPNPIQQAPFLLPHFSNPFTNLPSFNLWNPFMGSSSVNRFASPQINPLFPNPTQNDQYRLPGPPPPFAILTTPAPLPPFFGNTGSLWPFLQQTPTSVQHQAPLMPAMFGNISRS